MSVAAISAVKGRMRIGPTAARRLATSLALVATLALVGSVILEHELDAVVVGFLAFAWVGGLVAARRPQNVIGWLMIAIATLAVLAGYSRVIQLTVFGWTWVVAVALAITVLPLVFPDGRLPSHSWRRVGWLVVALFVLILVSFGFGPADDPQYANPLGIAPLAPLLGAGQTIAIFALVSVALVCIAAPVSRYRRTTGDERLQLKWFAAGAVVLVSGIVVSGVIDLAIYVGVLPPSADAIGTAAFNIALPVMPIAVGVAVLRYRLYEIDVIINRTLVWVPLTAFLGGLYGASVALFQRLFINVTGDRSDAAIVISTLMLAGAFTPARKVLDSMVDRRFRAGPPIVAPRHGLPADRPYLDDPDLERRIEEVAERVVRRLT